MNADWPSTNAGEAARELLRKAAMREVSVPKLARARVWQAIERKRSHRQRFGWRLGLTFLAGAAFASLLAVVFLRARLADTPALLVAADGTTHALHVGETLPKLGDLSVMDLHTAARVVVGAQSQARLERLDRDGATLTLERGSLLMHVLPRPVNAPFLVKTPAFTARVIGTVLRVAVDEQGRASLAVGHGAVELEPAGGGRSILVRAGERWPADSTAMPSPAELERLGADDLEGATSAHFAPPRPAAPAPAPPALSEESELYESGLSALEAHDPRGALALFRIERDRFPHGVLAREVRTSMIDSYMQIGDSTHALREIDAALADEPHGLRAPELHWLKASIERKLDGNCRRARGELERALLHPAEPWAQAARKLKTSCKRP